MNKYVIPFFVLTSSAQAEPVKLLCEEEGQEFDRQFAEELIIDIEAGTVQSNYVVPGSLEIVHVSEEYITAVRIFEDTGGGIVLVLDRTEGTYVWSRSSPSRMLITDEYTLSNDDFKGKCISPEPIL